MSLRRLRKVEQCTTQVKGIIQSTSAHTHMAQTFRLGGPGHGPGIRIMDDYGETCGMVSSNVAWVWTWAWSGYGDRIGIGIGMAWCHLHAAATLVKVMSRTKVSHNMHIPHTLVGKVLLWHLNTW